MAMHKLIIEHLERRNFLRAREIQSILARAATFPAKHAFESNSDVDKIFV
jgi:hypothetical protein